MKMKKKRNATRVGRHDPFFIVACTANPFMVAQQTHSMAPGTRSRPNLHTLPQTNDKEEDEEKKKSVAVQERAKEKMGDKTA